MCECLLEWLFFVVFARWPYRGIFVRARDDRVRALKWFHVNARNIALCRGAMMRERFAVAVGVTKTRRGAAGCD